MKIAVISMFRDETYKYVLDYFNRIEKLDAGGHLELGGNQLRLYLVEGDSKTADTYRHLLGFVKGNDRVLQTTTGIKQYGSVVHPERFECLAKTWNVGFEAIAKEGWADKVLLIESDLKYNDKLLVSLLEHSTDENVIVPVVMAGESFYDIWGFRYLNGNCVPPTFKPTKITELSSVGSCLLFPAKVLYDGIRMGMTEELVEFSGYMREYGLKIYVNPNIRIYQT